MFDKIWLASIGIAGLIALAIAGAIWLYEKYKSKQEAP